MVLRVLGAGFLAGLLFSSPAVSQTVASVGEPAERPPASYTGQQYVDSRGCVYLRAGLAGQINWVLRVDRARKPMCGLPPTFGAKPEIETVENTVPAAPAPATATAAPAPRMASGEKPMATIAGSVDDLPVQTASTALATAPTQSLAAQYDVAVTSRIPAGKIGCFTSAPKAERVVLRNGGTAVVCTRGDGSLTGWRSPIYPDGSRPGIALSDAPIALWGTPKAAAMMDGAASASASASASATTAHLPSNQPLLAGYKNAWSDDRLNPKRGLGTAQGWADQDKVWTRETPARAVAASNASVTAAPMDTRVSTKGSASDGTASYIVAGTFSVAANAKGAAQQLSSLGLPVAKSQLTRKGKTLDVVMAGPFASANEAASYLSAVRALGFADAFIR